jgi:hypothetical protein
MTKFWMVAMITILALGALFTTGCPDGSGDSDADCTPACGSGYTCVSGTCVPGDADADADGGADADSDGDADGDADGDVPVQYGDLTVTSTPVQGATIEIDGSPTGQITNYTFSSLATGAHSVLLSLAGRLAVPDGCTALPCPPASVNVTTTGTDVNIFLGWDLSGSWRREVDGEIIDFTMVVQPPDDRCPDTWLRVINVDPIGTLCLEGDDSLSLCNTRASSCGTEWTEGQILDNGRRVEITDHWETPPPAGEQAYVYTKL